MAPLTLPHASDLLADPQFAHGYFHLMDGRDSDLSRHWSEAETGAYARGRQFAAFVLDCEGRFLPLNSHGLPDTRAVTLLTLALRSGAVA